MVDQLQSIAYMAIVSDNSDVINNHFINNRKSWFVQYLSVFIMDINDVKHKILDLIA